MKRKLKAQPSYPDVGSSSRKDGPIFKTKELRVHIACCPECDEEMLFRWAQYPLDWRWECTNKKCGYGVHHI